jgi:hypothetical protein
MSKIDSNNKIIELEYQLNLLKNEYSVAQTKNIQTENELTLSKEENSKLNQNLEKLNYSIKISNSDKLELVKNSELLNLQNKELYSKLNVSEENMNSILLVKQKINDQKNKLIQDSNNYQ